MPGFVIALLVGLVVFPPLFASGTMREAFRLTFSAPAWLVPAAFSFVTALFYREFGRGVREHVFTQSDLPAGFLCAFLFTIGVAGQIGMLRARDAGRPADSVAFLTGLREHGAALYAGKLLIMLATTAVFRTLGRRGESVFADLLCLVPNVLLVGLVGTCAVHPKSVFHAIFAALGAGVRMPGLGRIVLAQTIALAAFGALAGGNQFRPAMLALQGTVLSHSPFPLLIGLGRDPLQVLAALGCAVLSSVCITATYLRVTRGPDPS